MDARSVISLLETLLLGASYMNALYAKWNGTPLVFQPRRRVLTTLATLATPSSSASKGHLSTVTRNVASVNRNSPTLSTTVSYAISASTSNAQITRHQSQWIIQSVMTMDSPSWGGTSPSHVTVVVLMVRETLMYVFRALSCFIMIVLIYLMS